MKPLPSYALCVAVAVVLAVIASCGRREASVPPVILMDEDVVAMEAAASPSSPDEPSRLPEESHHDSAAVFLLVDTCVSVLDDTAVKKPQAADICMDDPLSAVFAEMPDAAPADSARGMFEEKGPGTAAEDSAVREGIPAPTDPASEPAMQDDSVGVASAPATDTNDIFAMMAAPADTVVPSPGDTAAFGDADRLEEDVTVGLESLDSGAVDNDDIFSDIFTHDTAVYVKLQVHRDISQRFDEGRAADSVAALPESAVPAGSRHTPPDGRLKNILMLLMGLLAAVFAVAAVSLLLPEKRAPRAVKGWLSALKGNNRQDTAAAAASPDPEKTQPNNFES